MNTLFFGHGKWPVQMARARRAFRRDGAKDIKMLARVFGIDNLPLGMRAT